MCLANKGTCMSKYVGGGGLVWGHNTTPQQLHPPYLERYNPSAVRVVNSGANVDCQEHRGRAEAGGVPHQDAGAAGEPAALLHEQHLAQILSPAAGDAAGPPGGRPAGGVPQNTGPVRQEGEGKVWVILGV